MYTGKLYKLKKQNKTEKLIKKKMARKEKKNSVTILDISSHKLLAPVQLISLSFFFFFLHCKNPKNSENTKIAVIIRKFEQIGFTIDSCVQWWRQNGKQCKPWSTEQSDPSLHCLAKPMWIFRIITATS